MGKRIIESHWKVIIIGLILFLGLLLSCSSDKKKGTPEREEITKKELNVNKDVEKQEKKTSDEQETKKELNPQKSQQTASKTEEEPKDFMVVWAKVMLNGKEFKGGGNNMIGAFAPGEEKQGKARALGNWKELPYPNDKNKTFDVWHFVIYGFKHDTTDSTLISFYLYDSKTGKKYICNETVIFKNASQIGNPGEPFILTANNKNIVR